MPRRGYHQNQEQKNKISEKLKGIKRKPVSEETKNKIRQSLIKSFEYKKLSKKERNKIEEDKIIEEDKKRYKESSIYFYDNIKKEIELEKNRQNEKIKEKELKIIRLRKIYIKS
jgi:hypothetical protein